MAAVGRGTIEITADTKKYDSALAAAAKKAGDAARAAGKATQDAWNKAVGSLKSVATAAKKAGDATVDAGVRGASSAGKLSTAVLAAGAAYAKLANDVFGTVDQINTLAAGSGLSTDAVNGLRLAAKAANKDLTELFPDTLIMKMAQVENGASEAVRAFDKIGVQATDTNGALRSSDAVYRDVLAALFAIEDPTIRAASATELLGTQGKQTLSAFSSVEDFDRFVALGSEFGIKVGPDAVNASNAWWAATSNLSLAFENAKASIVQGNIAGENFSEWVDGAAVGLVFFAELVTGAFGGMADQLALVGQVVRGQASPLELMNAGFSKSHDILNAATWKAFEFHQATRTGTAAMQENTVVIDKQAQAYTRFTAIAGEASAEIDYASIVTADMTGGVRNMTDAYDNLDAALRASSNGVNEHQEALEALGAQWETWTEEAEEHAENIKAQFAAVGEAAVATGLATMNALTSIWTAGAEERARSAEDAANAALRAEESLRDELARLYEEQQAAKDGQTRAEIESQIIATEAQLEQRENETRAAKSAALETWRAQRATQLAAVAVNAAAAAGITLATTPFPVSLALAGLAAAAVGATGIAIAAAKPPEFPTGMSPDHQAVGIQRGEGIVSRRGVAAAGGSDAIAALNRGQSPGGGSSTEVKVSIDPRLSRLTISTDSRAGKRNRRR